MVLKVRSWDVPVGRPMSRSFAVALLLCSLARPAAAQSSPPTGAGGTSAAASAFRRISEPQLLPISPTASITQVTQPDGSPQVRIVNSLPCDVRIRAASDNTLVTATSGLLILAGQVEIISANPATALSAMSVPRQDGKGGIAVQACQGMIEIVYGVGL